MIILDTNILIEITKRNSEVLVRCDELGYRNLVTCAVTQAEFLRGTRDKSDFAKAKQIIQSFGFLEYNQEIDVIFLSLFEKYALSHRPAIPDMLIAAIALHHKASLLTLNTRDFQFIESLTLV
jgi:predicted nucleic acid-binding protein